ncbi:4-hydroxy-3-methylbut-2-en-1-yl diphosphate synthase (flavodoxin) [Spirochaetia bacterium]|nr:4-hydroxy-3-methylbut-2-en-1-yl diphosphate synthase (flavodoxin) [Spirochaetia bacterium]
MTAPVSRIIKIGGFEEVKAVFIGGDYPVVIQTMWKDRLSFANLENEAGEALARRINGLAAMGCGLLRFAVPAMADAEILGELASRVSMPLCADIHFDYKIALRCLDFPVAKLRINPGNIGRRNRVAAVVSKAAAKGVPIRIGVNAGSLPAPLREAVDNRSLDRAEALVKAALDELAVFDELGFTNTAVSMKASGIADTIKANRLFAERSSVPLHIGVTEAGPLVSGTVRNTAALLPLLAEGIGDTIRVSLSDSPENEVIAGREILNAEELGKHGAVIVSCPRCGRNGFDTIAFTERWKTRLYGLDKDCVIAIMGCAVNGPGEARHADLGITGAGNSLMIFRHGKVIRTLPVKSDAEADKAFEEELNKL